MAAGKAGTARQRQAGGVCYQLTRRRVKHLNLRVRADGTVAVSIPLCTGVREADAFVLAHKEWIEAAVARQHRRPARLQTGEADREAALARFTALSEAVYPSFAQALGGRMPVIKVRSMTSRWGSCIPAKRQLTFALALYAMPPEAQLYVVVHEFCHFLVPNHSPAFWAEVEKRLPDWKARRRLLREE